ncbi:DMT family transporter [Paracraurococcus sp. LOR1-02]|uniref:DMT family transporter n=1 Tax=Paracraurococcus lichenis TaxID=3064888 RepID=A0ABT9DT90_9PROT|nr:DMT family transporter [Paracraurococcus sp. LOR1-02]MDO9707040.1 DMT family transporter [Paracraurococcus sp. LOR1-02]
MSATRTEAAPDRVLQGILLILASVVLFSVSDAMAKLMRLQGLPAVEVAWLRYLVFIALAATLAGRARVLLQRPKRLGLQLLRGVTLVGSAVLFVAGLGFLPIAEATAITYVAPGFVTALSILFLGEQVGIRRWSAVFVGFAGVLIVIRPGTGALSLAALFPVASALCWAATIVITRRMGAGDRTETTVLWSAGTGLVLLSLLVPFGFVLPTWGQLGLGLAHGLCSSVGQYLVILAYRQAAASLLAPFSYVQLLFSTTLGWLIFAAVPDRFTLLGAAVIIGSGLYTVHRERVRARERVAARV